jgi:succinate dehydrogenase hydrophobic anchor subunit
MTSLKKHDKTRAKRVKKEAKAEIKARKKDAAPSSSSPAVRYAEFVRGCLSVLMGASLIVALVLGQRGAIVSLDDVIESLFAALAGKVVLALIALGLLLYGFKYLRLIR